MGALQNVVNQCNELLVVLRRRSGFLRSQAPVQCSMAYWWSSMDDRLSTKQPQLNFIIRGDGENCLNTYENTEASITGY